VMDYPCVKFGDFSFSRFGFIVRTDRQTESRDGSTLISRDYRVSAFGGFVAHINRKKLQARQRLGGLSPSPPPPQTPPMHITTKFGHSTTFSC